MSRIVIDPAELNALSVLCRNASYDVAGIATEAVHRLAPLAAQFPQAQVAVETAVGVLQRIAAQLDDDALAVASFGQRGADADALGDLGGNEHALYTRLTEEGQPE